MAHAFCSIFTHDTVKQQRLFAHMASPDKIQHGYPNLDNHHSLLAADRLLDLMRCDLA